MRTSALETINAIKRIKGELPGALTHVGLSNVSFGLHPYARQVVNSVFLHYCLEAGLDSAILHAAKIIPLARIDDTGRELARRLIFNERDAGPESGCLCFARRYRQSIAYFDCGGLATRACNAVSFRDRESSGQPGDWYKERER